MAIINERDQLRAQVERLQGGEPVAWRTSKAVLERLNDAAKIPAGITMRHMNKDSSSIWCTVLRSDLQELLHHTAQPAAPAMVPLTDEQLASVLTTAYGSPEWTMDDVRAARSVESAHGIGQPVGGEENHA